MMEKTTPAGYQSRKREPASVPGLPVVSSKPLVRFMKKYHVDVLYGGFEEKVPSLFTDRQAT